MPAKFSTLTVRPDGAHVLVVTLDRPAVLNAINTAMADDIASLFGALAADAGDARCIVLTGAGERAFSAGADLKERDGMTVEAWRAQHERFERAFSALMACPVPVIAAVNGHAFGGGLELALCCDFIYAVAGATLALPEVRLGIMPGGGGTQNLPRAVGERRAKEMILTGRAVTAEEGASWGLVNRVSAPGRTLADAIEAAREIAANAPLAVRQAKQAISDGMALSLLDGYGVEIEAYNRLVDTDDRREGVQAFNEKRKPRFTGR